MSDVVAISNLSLTRHPRVRPWTRRLASLSRTIRCMPRVSHATREYPRRLGSIRHCCHCSSIRTTSGALPNYPPDQL